MSRSDHSAIRLLQILVGEPTGGAERFFVKLAIAFHERGLAQKLILKREEARAAELRHAGCDVVELDFGKGVRDLVERRRLARIIAEFEPTFALAWMNRAARRMPRGDFVKAGRIGGYYRANAYRRCDWIIANTPALKTHIVADGWREDRTVTISNFGELAPARAVSRAELGTPAEATVLLAMGRLHPSKGFDLLIEASTRLPGAHVWIAGAGGHETELRDQARDLGVAERVHFLGWRSDQAALLQACDICVVPSRHEPLSNVVLEAWSLGVPVVATASEGPSWLIDNGVNGVLTPLDDAAGLEQGLRRLIEEPDLRRQIAAGGKRTWAGKFSKDAIVEQYLEFFLRAQATRSGASQT